MWKRKCPVKKYVVAHPVSLLKIKSARVDVGIQPAVTWLNAFDGIYTKWSCQGGTPRNGQSDVPYVLFYCEDTVDLIRVIRSLVGYATVEASFYETAGCLRYAAHFADKDSLKRFVADLPKSPWIARETGKV